ncbi:Hypothetical Protein FCC1311_022102 [Hondaea fermentalgiana]|uniref:Uncharacterized protein n=1 Tax=Hondaea fermentalgiana TaxID=2315210 RepID=A0A2R5G4S9_9STRA|nr:Hypothetical Protein FCC1311_022102 [Hondaea fermentalgiana]|eukprot:GBG25990.1 Hypothetical Protein FCC1311_022102 [Hondaea fermentalgiana]
MSSRPAAHGGVEHRTRPKLDLRTCDEDTDEVDMEIKADDETDDEANNEATIKANNETYDDDDDGEGEDGDEDDDDEDNEDDEDEDDDDDEDNDGDEDKDDSDVSSDIKLQYNETGSGNNQEHEGKGESEEEEHSNDDEEDDNGGHLDGRASLDGSSSTSTRGGAHSGRIFREEVELQDDLTSNESQRRVHTSSGGSSRCSSSGTEVSERQLLHADQYENARTEYPESNDLESEGGEEDLRRHVDNVSATYHISSSSSSSGNSSGSSGGSSGGGSSSSNSENEELENQLPHAIPNENAHTIYPEQDDLESEGGDENDSRWRVNDATRTSQGIDKTMKFDLGKCRSQN